MCDLCYLCDDSATAVIDPNQAGVTNNIKHGVKILGSSRDELEGIPQVFLEHVHLKSMQRLPH